MTTENSTILSNKYILGRSAEEYQRLREQASIWEAATVRVLQQAGLREGMSCLDVGCGPGEVMRLMGDVVGTSGQVTGFDADGKIGRQAIEMLQATTECRFSFLEGDLEDTDDIPGQPFDLTYARLVLFHVRDPIALLRKMNAWTKPGGLIVIQDYDLCTLDIYPRLESWDEFVKVVIDFMKTSGRDIYIGHKIPAYFVEAGIGDPDGTDVTGILDSLKRHSSMLRGIYRTLLPRAIQMGVTTEAESKAFLDELSREEEGERYYSVLPPLLISAWKRKPPTVQF
jgi:ubiquinone/menaquinone biosynthesis C-methylase UbiE